MFDCEKTKELLRRNNFTIMPTVQKTSIYILPDGSAIDGKYEYGIRTLDHRDIGTILDIDHYHCDFWDHVFHRLQLVLVAPETQVYMYPQQMKLTAKQRREIDRLRSYGYQYLEFK